MEKLKQVTKQTSRTFNNLKCMPARRTFIANECLQIILKTKGQMTQYSRVFGENEKVENFTSKDIDSPHTKTPLKKENENSEILTKTNFDSSIDGECEIPFKLIKKNRKREENHLTKMLKQYSKCCPLYNYITEIMGGKNIRFWAFFIGNCSPFNFDTIGHLLGYYGKQEIYSKRYKKKVKYTKERAKKLITFRTCMRMRKQQPLQNIVEELIPKLEKKHPTYKLNHIKNLAWYKTFFDKLIIPIYKIAKVECNRCFQKTK